MNIHDILRLLYPGTKDYLNASTASSLVLSLTIEALETLDSDSLRFLARFFTPEDFDNLVVERTVAGRCGFPLCYRELPRPKNPAQPRILLPFNAYSEHYCCRRCWQSARFYREQLSDEVLTSRKDVAYLPYGTMPYETQVIFLHELTDHKDAKELPIQQILVRIVKEKQERLGAEGFNNVVLPADPEITEKLAAITINEKYDDALMTDL